jgi:hypothetical protein
VGHYEQTPLIAFLNKGNRFSNLTGEKISEHQAAEAVEAALSRLGLRLSAYTLTPCCAGDVPRYSLFVEESDLPDPDACVRLAREVDQGLRSGNAIYNVRRESRQLEPVQVELLSAGAWDRWDAEQLERNGGTAEQYKHPVLVPDLDFRSTLAVHKAAGSLLQGR